MQCVCFHIICYIVYEVIESATYLNFIVDYTQFYDWRFICLMNTIHLRVKVSLHIKFNEV